MRAHGHRHGSRGVNKRGQANKRDVTDEMQIEIDVMEWMEGSLLESTARVTQIPSSPICPKTLLWA